MSDDFNALELSLKRLERWTVARDSVTTAEMRELWMEIGMLFERCRSTAIDASEGEKSNGNV